MRRAFVLLHRRGLAILTPRPIGSVLEQRRHEVAAPGRMGRGTSAEDEASHENRLPAANWKPREEFPAIHTPWWRLHKRPAVQRLQRVTQLVFASIAQRDTLALLGLSVGGVYAIGAAEAWLLLDSSFVAEQALGALRFVNAYAVEQIVPSCVWHTKPAPIVAAACGLDGTAALLPPFRATPPPHDALTAAEAATALQQQGLSAARSVAAGSTLLSQVLRAVNVSLGAGAKFEERVREGREPLFGGAEQRVLRLCGRRSDVTEVSLARMGAHLVPIFERPPLVRTLVREHSKAWRVPTYWQVAGRELPRVGTAASSRAPFPSYGRWPSASTRSRARGRASLSAASTSCPRWRGGGCCGWRRTSPTRSDRCSSARAASTSRWRTRRRPLRARVEPFERRSTHTRLVPHILSMSLFQPRLPERSPSRGRPFG
jgi:hypothetical protein